ncbi:uncharacterized protein FIBRA_07472 [Fibroporia radiculosa]|uniref:DUF6534 domain-containing protein n=1 Tax=Fibroporia radiculosa TaxID=599839 RepID=J4I0R1_9APHY|nr:uncharacterized protein FIBRA_07472 [Fibroporia radiculosa]CCM05262.1 predicted protein [Fibroporia radiculosa]
MASEAAEAQTLAQFVDGPCLAGIFMNVMLYGVMLTQTFFYYTTYRHDPTWIKVYVGILFFADTLNTAFNIAWIYGVLITNFGSLNAVIYANWLMETEEALTGIIGALVQVFYAWRLLKLTGKRWLAGTVVALAIIQSLAAIGTSINMAMRPLITNFVHYKEAVLVWLSATAFNDVLIALSLIWFLNRSRTGHSKTETVISKIIQITMSNGLLTASFALADIIAYVASPGGLHLAFNYTLCKLYGNSVMSSLNSRAILTSASRNPTGHTASSGRTMPHSDIDDIGSKGSRSAQVMVSVETHQMVDMSAAGNRKSDVGSHLSDAKIVAVV